MESTNKVKSYLSSKTGENAGKEDEIVVEIRRKQEELAKSIRSNSRNEYFAQRRGFKHMNQKFTENNEVSEATSPNYTDTSLPPQLRELISDLEKQVPGLEDLERLVAALYADNDADNYIGLIGLRRLLSCSDKPPIQEVIDSNVILKLMDYTHAETKPKMQFEAIWSLSNLAAGSTMQCQHLVDKGIIPLFINLLTSKNKFFIEQAIWGVANLAGDNYVYRDSIIEEGVAKIFDNMLRDPEINSNPETSRNIVWALSNLTRGEPLPDFTKVAHTIPTFAAFISSTNPEVRLDATQALLVLSKGDSQLNVNKLDCFMNENVLRPIFQLICEEKRIEVQMTLVRTVKNLLQGTEHHIRCLAEHGLFECLGNLLRSPGVQPAVIREALSCFSRLTSGTPQDIELLFKSGLISDIQEVIHRNQYGGDAMKYACLTLANITYNGRPDQMRRLAEMRILELFCERLRDTNTDAEVLCILLEGMYNLLKSGQALKNSGEWETNKYTEHLFQIEGHKVLEDKQNHSNNDVYNRALNILETFFEVSSEL